MSFLNQSSNIARSQTKSYQLSKIKVTDIKSQNDCNVSNSKVSFSNQIKLPHSKQNSSNELNINNSQINYTPSIRQLSNSVQLPVVIKRRNLIRPQKKRSVIEPKQFIKLTHQNDEEKATVIRHITTVTNSSKSLSPKKSTIIVSLNKNNNKENQRKESSDSLQHHHSFINTSKIIIVAEDKKRSDISPSQPLQVDNSDSKEDYLRLFCAKSQTGKNASLEIKHNQDSFLIKLKVNGVTDFNVFGVLDGHGRFGHCASQYAAKYIEEFFNTDVNLSGLTNINLIYKKLKEKNFSLVKSMFTSAEREMKKEDFDITFSGTTCVIIIQLGNKIISANVGDSRAILVTNNQGSTYQLKQLSIDQKPEMKNEKSRIVKAGGKVEQFSDKGVKIGPVRVWLKNEMYPGLAMSRSIGDSVATTVGVISEPVLLEFELSNERKECLIIASDGVWEFLDNKTVMNLSIPFIEKNDLNGLCQILIQESTNWWKKEDIVIDDITVACAIFNHNNQ